MVLVLDLAIVKSCYVLSCCLTLIDDDVCVATRRYKDERTKKDTRMY